MFIEPEESTQDSSFAGAGPLSARLRRGRAVRNSAVAALLAAGALFLAGGASHA